MYTGMGFPGIALLVGLFFGLRGLCGLGFLEVLGWMVYLPVLPGLLGQGLISLWDFVS